MSAFSEQAFESKLSNLKDTQEAISALSSWCLQHRDHHKKIVTCWLHCFKRVKVEQRLSLFYLANDVIQYSKRKHYPFVESWGIAIQQATTMVRDDRVKNKILRIFHIWEDRGVYDNAFIADLRGLLKTEIKKKKTEICDSSEFQATVLAKKIKECEALEKETDIRFKRVKENTLPLTDSDMMRNCLKDRRQGSDVSTEVDQGVKKMESYVKALEKEIREREKVVKLLTEAAIFYDRQRGEAKIVFNAYRNFFNKVKLLNKKLIEVTPTISESPIPSPDVNAPSPSPDTDIELPNEKKTAVATETNNGLDFSFVNNSSFIGSDSSILKDLQNDLFQNDKLIETFRQSTEAQAIQVINTRQDPKPNETFSISDFLKNIQIPVSTTENTLQPPPIPPIFTTPTNVPPPTTFNNNWESETKLPGWDMSEPPPKLDWLVDPSKTKLSGWEMNEPPPKIWEETLEKPKLPVWEMTEPPPKLSWEDSSDKSGITWSMSQPPPKINWEQQPENKLPGWEMAPPPAKPWSTDESWPGPAALLETPESPPVYEKESVQPPIVYDDSLPVPPIPDTDHRTLLPPEIKQDMDHRIPGGRRTRDQRGLPKDIDHRNLISLTGSPKNENKKPLPPPPAFVWPIPLDTDIRKDGGDIDFRIMPPSIEKQVPERKDCNVESVDMDVSEDDDETPQPNDFDPGFDMNSSFFKNMSGEVTDNIKNLLGQAHVGGNVIPDINERSNSSSRGFDSDSQRAGPENDFFIEDDDAMFGQNNGIDFNQEPSHNHGERSNWRGRFRGRGRGGGGGGGGGMRFPFRQQAPPAPLNHRPDFQRGRGGPFRSFRPRRW